MGDQASSAGNSLHDSLAPLDGTAKRKMKLEDDLFGDVIGFLREEKLLHSPVRATHQTPPPPPPPEDRTAQLDSTLQEQQLPAVPSKSPSQTCPPRFPQATLIQRSHRPSDLSLTRTNGLSTVSTSDLRRHIADARTALDDDGATSIQVPRPRPDNWPKTPATPSPLFVMGNNASTLLGLPPDDAASLRSGVARAAPVRMLRKSSANLLFNRRHDSRNPVPSRLTATVIQVDQRPSPSLLDAALDENNVVPEPESDNSSERSQDILSKPASTIRNDETSDPPKITPAIIESRNTTRKPSQSENRSPRKQSKSESDLRKRATLHRQNLSPTIPAPSPLPEDSPHKYGLKDRLDTPEVPEPEKSNVVQAQCRSSGLEIFHEAKSLQSASSFLNGLSTSRRRAETLQRSSESALPNQTRRRRKSGPNPLPSKPRRSPDRLQGHNFKSSGFAYARPLAMAQLKCYRNHMRLIPSSNKRAPVECAVCHIDDEQGHFSCSWCAVRMCRFCRKDMVEKGMEGLRERIKMAEFSFGGDEEDVALSRRVEEKTAS